MQFSLFGAAVAEPSLDDLGGVLLAGGHWARSVSGARLSIVVADGWRADALRAEFGERGLAVGDPRGSMSADGGVVARTAFSPVLVALARDWRRGANDGPPADFALTPGGLRLWAVAAGRVDGTGYLLGTVEVDNPVHSVAGVQLSRYGVTAASLTGRGGGPGWRVTSTRRLRRLAELLGERPSGAGANWPVPGP